jgi:lactoylglutathione lyase
MVRPGDVPLGKPAYRAGHCITPFTRARHLLLSSPVEWQVSHAAITKGHYSMRVSYAIIFVGDMARSVSFYRDVLGLPLRFESPGWAEFATEGATLALHKSDGSKPDDDKTHLESAGQCRPGFQVPNLDEFHERMMGKNVPCNQEPTEVFGARIAQYIDPDGLVFSVGEERPDG